MRSISIAIRAARTKVVAFGYFVVLGVLFFFGGVTEAQAISFVGSCENSIVSGADVTLTLPATEVGDLVIVAYENADADGVDFDMAVTSPVSTFTEVADLFSNDVWDASLGVYYDITDDSYTTVTVDGLGGADTAVVAVCMVFRGVDTTTPMDVTPTTATGLNTFSPNLPSINHNNPAGVWTVIAGASAHDLNTTSVTYTFPTGYTTNALEIGQIDTTDGTVGMGYRSSGVSDPEDPGTMTHSGTDNITDYAWAAATIALRPLPPISISGTCKQSDQSTDCSDTGSNVVSVAVNGTLQAQTDTAVDGSWSITGVSAPAANDIVTVFIEGEAASNSQAVGVTKYGGTGNIGGIELFESGISIGSDQNTTIANSDLAAYDSSVSSKRTFMDVNASNNLVTDTDGNVLNDTLFVRSGDTYRPDSVTGRSNTLSYMNNSGTITADANTFTASGSWDSNGTFTAGTSTVSLTGTGTVDGHGGDIFNILTVNTAGTVTASGSFSTAQLTSSAGTFSIPSGATITLTSFLSLSGTISGAGTLRLAGSGMSFPLGGTITAAVKMDTVNGSQTLRGRTYGGPVTIENSGSVVGFSVTLGTSEAEVFTFSSGLDIAESGTGSVTLNGVNNPLIIVSGNFTCSSGTGNNFSSGFIGMTVGGNLNLTNCSTVTLQGTVTMNGSGTLTSNGKTLPHLTLSGTVTLANETHTVTGSLNMAGGTISAGSSTLTMTGTASPTITGGGATLNNLVIDPASAATIALATSDLTVSGSLTVASGDTFVVRPGITLTLSGTGTPLSVVGTFAPDDSSTVRYSGSSANVTSATYGHLRLGGSGAYTLPSSGAPTIKGDLIVASGATVASGSATLLFSNGGTGSITDNTAAKQNLGEISVVASTGGNSLVTLGSSVKIASASIGALQTLNLNGSNVLEITGAGVPLTVAGSFERSTGAVAFTAGGATSIPALNFHDLRLLPSADSTTFTFLAGTSSVSKTLLIGNGMNLAAVVDASANGTGLDVASVSISAESTLIADESAEFTVSGNWSNGGAFTHSSGTVTLAGAATTLITGGTVFNNVTAAVPGKTVRFQAHGTFRFDGDFTVTGNGGDHVNIQSDESGLQWIADFAVPQSSVTFATIMDSGCAAGSENVSLGTGMTDGGHTGTCWFQNSNAHRRLSAGGGATENGQSGGGSPQGGGGAAGGGATENGQSGGGSPQGGGGAAGGGATP